MSRKDNSHTPANDRSFISKMQSAQMDENIKDISQAFSGIARRLVSTSQAAVEVSKAQREKDQCLIRLLEITSKISFIETQTGLISTATAFMRTEEFNSLRQEMEERIKASRKSLHEVCQAEKLKRTESGKAAGKSVEEIRKDIKTFVKLKVEEHKLMTKTANDQFLEKVAEKIGLEASIYANSTPEEIEETLLKMKADLDKALDERERLREKLRITKQAIKELSDSDKRVEILMDMASVDKSKRNRDLVAKIRSVIKASDTKGISKSHLAQDIIATLKGESTFARVFRDFQDLEPKVGSIVSSAFRNISEQEIDKLAADEIMEKLMNYLGTFVDKISSTSLEVGTWFGKTLNAEEAAEVQLQLEMSLGSIMPSGSQADVIFCFANALSRYLEMNVEANAEVDAEADAGADANNSIGENDEERVAEGLDPDMKQMKHQVSDPKVGNIYRYLQEVPFTIPIPISIVGLAHLLFEEQSSEESVEDTTPESKKIISDAETEGIKVESIDDASVAVVEFTDVTSKRKWLSLLIDQSQKELLFTKISVNSGIPRWFIETGTMQAVLGARFNWFDYPKWFLSKKGWFNVLVECWERIATLPNTEYSNIIDDMVNDMIRLRDTRIWDDGINDYSNLIKEFFTVGGMSVEWFQVAIYFKFSENNRFHLAQCRDFIIRHIGRFSEMIRKDKIAATSICILAGLRILEVGGIRCFGDMHKKVVKGAAITLDTIMPIFLNLGAENLLHLLYIPHVIKEMNEELQDHTSKLKVPVRDIDPFFVQSADISFRNSLASFETVESLLKHYEDKHNAFCTELDEIGDKVFGPESPIFPYLSQKSLTYLYDNYRLGVNYSSRNGDQKPVSTCRCIGDIAQCRNHAAAAIICFETLSSFLKSHDVEVLEKFATQESSYGIRFDVLYEMSRDLFLLVMLLMEPFKDEDELRDYIMNTTFHNADGIFFTTELRSALPIISPAMVQHVIEHIIGVVEAMAHRDDINRRSEMERKKFEMLGKPIPLVYRLVNGRTSMSTSGADAPTVRLEKTIKPLRKFVMAIITTIVMDEKIRKEPSHVTKLVMMTVAMLAHIAAVPGTIYKITFSVIPQSGAARSHSLSKQAHFRSKIATYRLREFMKAVVPFGSRAYCYGVPIPKNIWGMDIMFVTRNIVMDSAVVRRMFSALLAMRDVTDEQYAEIRGKIFSLAKEYNLLYYLVLASWNRDRTDEKLKLSPYIKKRITTIAGKGATMKDLTLSQYVELVLGNKFKGWFTKVVPVAKMCPQLLCIEEGDMRYMYPLVLEFETGTKGGASQYYWAYYFVYSTDDKIDNRSKIFPKVFDDNTNQLVFRDVVIVVDGTEYYLDLIPGGGITLCDAQRNPAMTKRTIKDKSGNEMKEDVPLDICNSDEFGRWNRDAPAALFRLFE